MKEIKGTTVRRRYARLPLALALGALVLTPAVIGFGAATAEASVAGKGETSITISGDARLRGFWKEDAAFGDKADDTDRQLQHRMRIALDAKAAGGTSLHTQFNMANNSMDTWGASTDDKDAKLADNNANLNVATDYLFVRVPVGPGTVIAGRQVINYGHKLRIWDGRGDRLTYLQKLNDDISLFGYYQKVRESQSWDGTKVPATLNKGKDEDHNLYAVGMAYSAGDLTANVLVQHQDQEWTNGKDGQELIGFATLKIDDLTLEFEGHFTVGDLFENAQGDNAHKAYLGAAYQLGDTKLTGGLAYAMAGSSASGHFGKLSLFHNTSDGSNLGHTRFGAVPKATTDAVNAINVFLPVADQISTDVDKAMAIGFGASHRLSPALTIGGRLAYTVNDYYDSELDDGTIISVDAGMAYKINASTTYHIDAIYANVDDVSFEDDSYFGLSHRFEIKF